MESQTPEGPRAARPRGKEDLDVFVEALLHPHRTWQRLLHRGRRISSVDWPKAIGKILGCTPDEISSYVTELREEDFQQRIEGLKGGEWRGEASHAMGEVLYAACRRIRPEVVVETGVASGVASAYILYSLQRNRSGTLYSIDLPNYEQVLVRAHPEIYSYPVAIVPPGKGVGWAIPEELRTRWSLRIGKSSEVLPALLREVGRVDVFFHDSEHTYENMMNEYQLAWEALRPDGILASDDVSCTDAFRDFSIHVGVRPMILHGRWGILRRRPGSSLRKWTSTPSSPEAAR